MSCVDRELQQVQNICIVKDEPIYSKYQKIANRQFQTWTQRLRMKCNRPKRSTLIKENAFSTFAARKALDALAAIAISC